MKTIAYTVSLLIVVLVIATAMGMVGFHYPRIIQDQPLNNPIKVMRIESNMIYLADSRIIEFEVYPGQNITNRLSQSDFMIDLESGADDLIGIYARQDGWVCGTPWAQLIRIPIIPDIVYKNRRELILIGKMKEDQSTMQVEHTP